MNPDDCARGQAGTRVLFPPDAAGLAYCRWLNQSRNLFQNTVHAHAGIYSRVHFVMVRAGMHDQNLRSRVRFLDHVRQVMAIVLGQCSAQYDEVKSASAEGSLYGLAALGGGHLMPSLFHFGRVSGECRVVRLPVKNPDRILVSSLLSGCGQWASMRIYSELIRSLAIG
jgi:hypothetical protein